jgi:hypothetical protein
MNGEGETDTRNASFPLALAFRFSTLSTSAYDDDRDFSLSQTFIETFSLRRISTASRFDRGQSRPESQKCRWDGDLENSQDSLVLLRCLIFSISLSTNLLKMPCGERHIRISSADMTPIKIFNMRINTIIAVYI